MVAADSAELVGSVELADPVHRVSSGVAGRANRVACRRPAERKLALRANPAAAAAVAGAVPDLGLALDVAADLDGPALLHSGKTPGLTRLPNVPLNLSPSTSLAGSS